MLAAITLTSIILWAICLFLAVGVAWTRYEKKKTREKFIAELLAMDPARREKVDPWFMKPYEPTASSHIDAAPEPAKSGLGKPGKQKMAALLGGIPKGD